jgi:hypothetical protein
MGQPLKLDTSESPARSFLRSKSGGQKYKKGYEVRLVAATRQELKQIRQLLIQIGFKPAKPFRKARRIAQPVYGKAAVKWFAPAKLK